MVVFHSKLFAEDSIEGWKPLEERIDANIISTIHFKSVRADKIFKTYRNVKMCWVDKIRCLLFDDCKMLVNSRNGCYRYWILTAPHQLESPSLDLQWSEGNDWVTNILDIIPSSSPPFRISVNCCKLTCQLLAHNLQAVLSSSRVWTSAKLHVIR